MKVLLDECIDRRLAGEFTAFDVSTAAERGWSGITKGDLLTRAAIESDVLVTVDRNLPCQQHLARYPIAVALVEAVSNRLADLVRLVPPIVAVIPTAPGTAVTRVGP